MTSSTPHAARHTTCSHSGHLPTIVRENSTNRTGTAIIDSMPPANRM